MPRRVPHFTDFVMLENNVQNGLDRLFNKNTYNYIIQGT